MKRLVRLLLINWYRLEQASIDIVGHTAVIGPNASGKSSLLDAIQAVLVGGDKRWWNPNASAGEKSTRSLRDYCLGVVRDPNNPDLSQEFRPRDQAVTYLALVFRDDQSGEPISIGLALHARLDEAQEVIDGRFLAPGLELVLSDLVDRTAEGPVPKPWRRLREDLRMRLGEPFRVLPRWASTNATSAPCSPTAGATWTRRASCAPSATPSPSPPSATSRTSCAATSWRSAPSRSARCSRPCSTTGTSRLAPARHAAVRRPWPPSTATTSGPSRPSGWGSPGAGWSRRPPSTPWRRSWSPCVRHSERLAAEIAALGARIADLDRQWQLADGALTEANRRLAATNVEQQRERVRAEMRSAQANLDAASRDIDAARIGLGAVHRLLDSAARLDDGALVQALQALPPLLRRDEGLLAVTWPQSPGEVMAAVARIAPRVSEAVDRMLARFEQLVREEGDMARATEDLRGRIARLERGESDLRPATLRLIALLAEHGITAVPLCDRVDVADARWRDALESFLGGHREALLVDPGQVREAVGLYRREGRRLDIHGSRIINTIKTVEWRDRRTAGSLAEIAVSDDPHALAYVNQRAGNVLRVETEDELLRHERAITADGMLATAGAVLRLRPEEPMLGREARRLRLAALQEQFQTDGQVHYLKQQEKEAIQDLRERQLMPLNDRLRDFPDLVALAAARQQAQADLNRLKAEEQALLDDVDYRRLQSEVEHCRVERERIRGQADQSAKDLREREHTEQARRLELERKDAEARGVAERREAIQQTAGFDAQLAAERLEELQAQELFAQESPATWRALGEEAARRGGIQERTVLNQRAQARDGLMDYWAAWSSEHRPATGAADDHLTLAAWVVRELTQVRETELARYVTEADNALREAEHAFRADFVGKLQENLQLLEESRRELNRNLRHRPFHGQYYGFIKQPEPDLKQVLDWVLAWTPEQGSDVGGLFDAAGDPNHPHREAIARVRNLLMEAAGGEGRDQSGGGGWDERLADYRQYYHFDVRMSDDKDGGGNPELLSRRLGKGSGGEHQSPFYVAIGAALAAAYRIERDQDGAYRGGMALAVFDEAFSKLDLQNTVSALGFLDELGLQVLLAAPDEKYGQIAEHVDTIVNVYRDGGSVHIDAEYIKPEARRALAADNPVVRPDSPPLASDAL